MAQIGSTFASELGREGDATGRIWDLGAGQAMRVISEIDAAGKDGNGGKISGHTRCSIFKEFLILILMNGPKTSRTSRTSRQQY